VPSIYGCDGDADSSLVGQKTGRSKGKDRKQNMKPFLPTLGFAMRCYSRDNNKLAGVAQYIDYEFAAMPVLK
jgi:hypothetical protein